MFRCVILAIGIFCASLEAVADSWDQAKRAGSAELNLIWYTSRPFISQGPDGEMIGIEYEMMVEFQRYIKDEYNVDLKLNWIEGVNFPWIFNEIRNSEQTNVFGISAYSITDKREEQVKFTMPYMPDVTVLVSSQGTPIVDSFNEIDEFMKDMEAVTIRSTTYEGMLQDLKRQLNIDFKVKYIESGQNILDQIREAPNRFGFIDLPIYLMLIKNGGEVTRQNFFTIKGRGYGIIMPQHSDWDAPINEFLSNPEHAPIIAKSISKYLGSQLTEFIGDISESDHPGTSLLTKEKEIQLALIKNANLKLEEDQAIQNFLVWGISISVLFILIIGFLYAKNNRKTRILKDQKAKIEEQQDDIRRKNEQLTNRNRQLIEINEDKRNLVNILAHDLRSPLGQVIALVSALKTRLQDLDPDDRELFNQLETGSNRMNLMINKMLDENSSEDVRSNVMVEQVNVKQLMYDISSRYSPVASKKAIRLSVSSCSEDYLLATDHLLLLQVLENLVSNAIKFSEGNKEVWLSADCSKEEVVFKITDQGPGFSDQDKELMFGRYKKLSAKPTGNEPSTGLGLSIVKKYVNELGGSLSLETKPGNGSTFSVKIPVES